MLQFSIITLALGFFPPFDNNHANFEVFIAGREGISRIFIQHYCVM